MSKPLRIVGRILGGLVALILLVVVVSYAVSASRLEKHYEVAAANIAVPTDSASIARGHVLATLNGCTSCHGSTLGGRVMIDQFPFARLPAPNLTRGAGGIGATYTDADWERAIRHGVRRDGTPLFIMPANEFNPMRDEELGRLIAYAKSVPPVDNANQPSRTIYPLARVLHTFGAPLVSAEHIDHTKQVKVAPPPSASLAYGEYVAGACKFCHGADLSGQEVGGEPGAPPSPPIGPTGRPAKWTEAQFFQTMRTGVTPEGWKLRNEYMPWQAIGQLGDDELRAVLLYLKQPVAVAAR